ncbi:MAG: hypothetical protein ACJ75B_04670 [Flavisolibacter sp.]
MRNLYIIILFVIVIAGCDKNSSSDKMNASSGNTGVAGSLAQFTLIGNYIYAVSSHNLYTVDISNPQHPSTVKQDIFNYDMETIYPYKNRLFIGSRTGIYIYSIDTPSAPRLMGIAKHGRSCDPVVANDTVSFSTLKSSTYCGPATSGLYVYDVHDLNNPSLKKTIPINEPIGLGMADSALYVCCSGEGLRVFNIKNAYEPVERLKIPDSDFKDVIPYDDLLICWVADGISLYDITDRLHPVFVKKLSN